MKKNKPVSAIDKLHQYTNALIAMIPHLDEERTQFKLKNILAMEHDVYKEMKKRGGDKHYPHFINSLKKADQKKSTFHNTALMNKIRYVADDRPAEEGQEVFIIKYEHGWCDGYLFDKVKTAKQSGGKWYYYVNILEAYGERLARHYEITIHHSRYMSY